MNLKGKTQRYTIGRIVHAPVFKSFVFWWKEETNNPIDIGLSELIKLTFRCWEENHLRSESMGDTLLFEPKYIGTYIKLFKKIEKINQLTDVVNRKSMVFYVNNKCRCNF